MKKKIYVLIISDSFLTNHPKAGQPTDFEQKIRTEEKKHTIRGNYNFWKKREAVINAGDGILSIRKWIGSPYNSKQIELFRIHYINVHKVSINDAFMYAFIDESLRVLISEIAKNDGLSKEDFVAWFDGCHDKAECIISFGNFKY